MLPALIFDLDGTLWDACKEIGEAWTIVGKKYFGDDYVVTLEMARSQMGKTMEEIANALMYSELPQDEKDKFIKEAFEYEIEYLKDNPGKLFGHELEVLCSLKDKGYPLYIVSNCQTGYIEKFLPLAPSLFIDHMCWSDTGKPKNVTIRALMERNGIENAIYIGDTEKDEDAAHKAGLPFLHAAYGFGSALAPEGVAHSFTAIPEQIYVICRLFNFEIPANAVDCKVELASKYLTSSQVEMLRIKVADITSDEIKSTHIGFIALVDSFVRNNGADDPEYDAFYELVQQIIMVNSSRFNYSSGVMTPMPLVVILIFFQYLILVGVYNEKDMIKMAVPFPGFDGKGSFNPTA